MDEYFKLRDDVGVTADGNLEPLCEIGIVVAVPIMKDGELIDDPHRYVIEPADTLKEDGHARIIPGTRIVHVNDPVVAQGVLQTGMFGQVDKPTRKDQAAERRALTDAKEEAGTHNGDRDPTNPDNPVTPDGTPVHPVIPNPSEV